MVGLANWRSRYCFLTNGSVDELSFNIPRSYSDERNCCLMDFLIDQIGFSKLLDETWQFGSWVTESERVCRPSDDLIKRNSASSMEMCSTMQGSSFSRHDFRWSVIVSLGKWLIGRSHNPLPHPPAPNPVWHWGLVKLFLCACVFVNAMEMDALLNIWCIEFFPPLSKLWEADLIKENFDSCHTLTWSRRLGCLSQTCWMPLNEVITIVWHCYELCLKYFVIINLGLMFADCVRGHICYPIHPSVYLSVSLSVCQFVC